MKKIGIIGAMELEVETLKSKMNVAKTTKKEILVIGQISLLWHPVVVGTVVIHLPCPAIFKWY